MKNLLKRNLTSFAVAIVLGLASCNKTNDASFSNVDNQNVSTETATDAKVDEVNDIASSALNSNDSPTGRVEGRDDRLDCAIITREPSNAKEAGKITLVFNGDCKDDDGDVRTGKVIINWSNGRWFNPGSVYTIVLEGYSINGVSIAGTRTVTNVSTTELPLTWNVEGSHISTWPDGTSASRTVKRTRQWIRSANDPNEDKWIISQTDASVPAAIGTNRKGKSYSTQITTPLQYFASCGRRVHIPVTGVKVVTVEADVYTVDYGDGTCDHLVTVTSGDATKTVKIDKDGK